MRQDLVEGAGKSFLQAVRAKKPHAFFGPENSFIDELQNPRFFAAFLNELENKLRKNYLEAIEDGIPGRSTMNRYELWNSSLSKQKKRLESYNMNPVLLLHSLYKEVADEEVY